MIARTHVFRLLLSGTLLASGTALAQAPTPLTAPPPPAPPAMTPVAPTALGPVAGQPLALEKGASQLIRLPRPARDVLVANPKTADVVLRNPDTAFVVAKDLGETTVYFLDADGRQIAQVDVTVGSHEDAITTTLRRVLPRDDITVSVANQSVVLTGSVASQQDADNARLVAAQFVGDKQVVNLLKVHDKNQVLLRVRVTEMDRNAVKELGITPGFPAPLQFSIGGISFDFAGTPTQFANTPYGSVFVGNPQMPGTAPSYGLSAPLTPTPFVVPGQALAAPSRNLNALLQALEQNNMVRTLAEPNLTAMSGETATFRVGGEFFYPAQVAIGASSGIAAEPYAFGIQLTFTPVVLSGGLISLRIATNVSEPVPNQTTTVNGTQLPNLTLRSAATTVELPSGGSVAIAGLLEDDINNTIAGLPGVMNLPILGALFSSKQFQHNETDLVIAVTAYLVNATDANSIVFPSDGFGPASDFNMYFLGKLNATYTKPTPEAPRQPQGPFGFILE